MTMSSYHKCSRIWSNHKLTIGVMEEKKFNVFKVWDKSDDDGHFVYREDSISVSQMMDENPFCHSVVGISEPEYDIVDNTYCNGEGYYTIDAWKPNSEEGHVVAFVNSTTGEVAWVDNGARGSDMIKSAIREVRERLSPKMYVLSVFDANKDDMCNVAIFRDKESFVISREDTIKRLNEAIWGDDDEHGLDKVWDKLCEKDSALFGKYVIFIQMMDVAGL